MEQSPQYVIEMLHITKEFPGIKANDDRAFEESLGAMSPFEVKNLLVKMAKKGDEGTTRTLLNAGRGNPNWITTLPREAFFLLGSFAMEEARRTMDEPDYDLAGMPAADGAAARFLAFLDEHGREKPAQFLKRAWDYLDAEGLAGDELVHEWTGGIAGDEYPMPDRILRYTEQIVNRYLVKALDDVNVSVEHGQFVAVIGISGSGKSTLLKCIYRILKPDAGAVYLDGEELHSMSVRSSAKKMAVVAQHNYYNFDFTVREVVLMGRAPHKKTLERDNAKDYQIVDEALKTVQMEAFADRTFSTLSGGEQQRVILARALAQQTSALILDEPTNHLDITHQIMLMELVKKLNVTVISAIHDLNIAAAYCDKIYVLKDGVLEGYGTPEEVLTPELIRRIYKVEAEIVYDSRGKMHILFL